MSCAVIMDWRCPSYCTRRCVHNTEKQENCRQWSSFIIWLIFFIFFQTQLRLPCVSRSFLPLLFNLWIKIKEKASWGPCKERETQLGLKNRKKISKIVNEDLYLLFSLLSILCLHMSPGIKDLRLKGRGIEEGRAASKSPH